MTAIRAAWRLLLRVTAGLALLLGLLWAFGALWYDLPFPSARHAAAILFAAAALAVLMFARPWWRSHLALACAVGLVVAWWLTLRPSNTRDWQGDVAEMPAATIDGDLVTIHNVRDFEYRTATEYTPRWKTRTVRLSRLTGVDIAVNFWGSPWMAHPIVSFQFDDAPPLCFSIETRRTVGENYSAIGGFYRQFELIYIAAEERDVLRVRTNYRSGEDVYLYRMRLDPDLARERFLEYLASANALRAKPRWYNAITTNCTTSIRAQHPAAERPPWDWRILLNGKGDELMYERRSIETDNLPFTELKQRARINEAARAADGDPDFSRRIREGRPGFP